MHPGPMNRGVEIGSEVADDIDRSLIRQQVEMGVAVRMACLEILSRDLGNNPPVQWNAAMCPRHPHPNPPPQAEEGELEPAMTSTFPLPLAGEG